MTREIERAERLLAVPTADNVRAALELIGPRASELPPKAVRRFRALLDNALAIRSESYRLACGGGSYAPDGRWETEARRGGTTIEA